MYYQVSKEFFDKLPNACFGAVAVRGLDNTHEIPELEQMLAENVAACETYFAGKKPKETEDILPYRAAFTSLGINPNKFMCSIESLMKRVQKSGALPHINTVVDLGNAFSLTYQLPMGAHDVDKLEGDIQIRFSTPEDHFLPMGEEGMETMPAGELVYVSGHTVKTRRWIWRQSEDGKITGDTSHVFFPIDGFRNVNGADVLTARDALARLLEQDFGTQVVTVYVDSGNNVFDFE